MFSLMFRLCFQVRMHSVAAVSPSQNRNMTAPSCRVTVSTYPLTYPACFIVRIFILHITFDAPRMTRELHPSQLGLPPGTVCRRVTGAVTRVRLPSRPALRHLRTRAVSRRRTTRVQPCNNGRIRPYTGNLAMTAVCTIKIYQKLRFMNYKSIDSVSNQ